MMVTKPLVVRLDDQHRKMLVALSQLQGKTMSDIVKTLIKAEATLMLTEEQLLEIFINAEG